MRIELKEITVRDLAKGYKDNAEAGVVGYSGKLDIRPPYQREFIYKDKQRDAVINTVSPLRERIVHEKIIAENSGIKKKRMKMQFSAILNFIYRNINNSDKKIIYSIRGYKFIKTEKVFSNVAKPFKKIDMVFTNILKSN